MPPNQINDIFKCALSDAGIPFRTDGTGEVELQDIFPKFTKTTINGEVTLEDA